MYYTPNFLPSTDFFREFLKKDRVLLDASDIYFKQTARNRAMILGANRVEKLIVPVHASSGKTKSVDVRIDLSMPWQRSMIRTMEAAYRNSPFYQYYDYLLLPAIQKKYDFLIDLQMESLAAILKCMQWSMPICLEENSDQDFIYQKTDNIYIGKSCLPYHQTFGGEFVPRLSIIDLLFNLGPETKNHLIKETQNEH